MTMFPWLIFYQEVHRWRGPFLGQPSICLVCFWHWNSLYRVVWRFCPNDWYRDHHVRVVFWEMFQDPDIDIFYVLRVKRDEIQFLIFRFFLYVNLPSSLSSFLWFTCSVLSFSGHDSSSSSSSFLWFTRGVLSFSGHDRIVNVEMR